MKYLLIGALFAMCFVTTAFSQRAMKIEINAPENMNPGKEAKIEIKVKVAKTWHIYSHKDKSKNAFKVTPEIPEGFTCSEVEYPIGKEGEFFGEKHLVYAKDFVVSFRVRPTKNIEKGTYQLGIRVSYQGCNDMSCEVKNLVYTFPVTLGSKQVPKGEQAKIAITRLGKPSPESKKEDFSKKSLWAKLLLAFIGGLVTSLTPCVYPMIPITIAFFSNQSRSKSRWQVLWMALVFVLGIATLYTSMGVLAGMFKKNFNVLLQNKWVIATLAGVFFLLGLSLFGLFTLRLPSFLTRHTQVTRGGYLGAYGRGLFLGIIAAPCMGPVLVLILPMIPDNPLLGGLFLFVYACGVGVLFVALALFAGFLPKGGKWTHYIEILLGVLIFCMGLYFLEMLISLKALAIVIGCLAVLLCAYTTKKAIEQEQKRVGSFIVPILAFLLILVFLGGFSVQVNKKPLPEFLLNKAFFYGDWMKDYNKARDLAAKEHKPLLVDVWAKWCIPCKELDITTFRDERVLAELKRFVVVKLDITKTDAVEEEVLERFEILGPPSLIFFDSDGKHVKTIKSKADTDTILETLKSIR